MIRVFRDLYGDGRSAPRLCCDICGLAIDEVKLAALCWQEIEPKGVSDGLLVHKGECHTKADAQLGNGYPLPWTELGAALVRLAMNCNATPEHLARVVQAGELG